MYYRQKGELVFSTTQRRNQRLNQIQNYLSGVTTRSTDLRSVDTADGPSIRIQIDYNTQADADPVWSDVQTMRDSADIIAGFMGYGSIAETEAETSTSIGYRWWY